MIEAAPPKIQHPPQIQHPPKIQLDRVVERQDRSEREVSKLIESNLDSRTILLSMKEKLENIMRMYNLPIPAPKDPLPPIVRDPSNASSEILFVPDIGTALDQNMKLINLERDIAMREGLTLGDLTGWHEKDLGSASGKFTNGDPLLVFATQIFDFLNKHNQKLFKQLRLLLLEADPSTYKYGGFSQLLKRVSVLDPMPADQVRKMLIVLAQELNSKSTVRIMEVADVFEFYLLGLVSYFRDVVLKIGSQSMPSELSPEELYKQLAKTFDLTYSQRKSDLAVVHVFGFADNTFEIEQSEGLFTGAQV